MSDASMLAEQLRQARLTHAGGPRSVAELKLLEQRLAQTWIAIRLARLPATEALSIEHHHSKWE